MFHRIIPVVGSYLSGSLDSDFTWLKLYNDENIEGIYLSSSGIRGSADPKTLVGAIYNFGHIDCGFSIMLDTKYQRPALNLYSQIVYQGICYSI